MNLAAKISLDTAGFLNPLNAAKGALGGFTNSLQTLGNIGNIFSGLQSALSLARGAIAPLGQAIQGAADFESLNAEFEVMLGSAEKAARMVADIKKFAAATPFETAGLAQAGKTLLAFGTDSEKIVPTLKMLGDVAGSSQERMDRISLAFAQITSAGKLMGQDLLQLINAGFNPLQEISRTTGQSMADLREQMEKGAISSTMVEDAFRSATSEGGRFFGNTAAQGQTFSGLLSTLRDGVADLYRAFGEPVMLALKPLLEEAKSLAAGLQPIVADLGTRFAGIVASVGQIAGTLAKGLLGAFKAGELGDLFSLALRGAAQLFIGSIGSGFKAVIDVFASVLKGAFQGAAALLSDGSFWASIGHQVQAIVAAAKSAILKLVADVIDSLPPSMRIGSKSGALREGSKAADLQAEAHALTGAALMDDIDFAGIVAPIADAGKSVFATLKGALDEFLSSAANQPELQQLKARLEELGKTFSTIAAPVKSTSELIAEEREKIALESDRLKAKLDGTGDKTKSAEATSGGGAPVQSDAWAQVGAFVNSGATQQVSEQRRTNSLMEKAVSLSTATLDFWKTMNPAGAASWA